METTMTSPIVPKYEKHRLPGTGSRCSALFPSLGFLYGEQGCDRKCDQSDSTDDPHQGIGQSEIKER